MLNCSARKADFILDKLSKVLRIIIIGFGAFFVFISFLPILSDGTNIYFGFELFFVRLNIQSSIALMLCFLCPLLGSIMALFSHKIKGFELIGLVLFALGGVLILIAPSLLKEEITYYLFGYSIAMVALSFLLALLSFVSLLSNNEYSIYEIVETAMLIALAIGLDLPGLKIPLGVSGGSISFTMVPLFILCLRQGPIKGFLGCGVVYGIITCLLDGWGLQTFPLDYLLGYGSLCVIGFFKPLIFKRNVTKFNIKGAIFIVVGVLLSSLLRLLFSSLSGVVLYETDFVASVLYNLIYILPSGGIASFVLVALYHPLIMINRFVLSKTRHAINGASHNSND